MYVATGTPTLINVEQLLKLKNKSIPEFVFRAREAISYAMQQRRIWTVLRLSKELENIDHPDIPKELVNVSEFEDYVISTGDAHYTYYWAREIRTANIPKLQKAIVNTGCYDYVASFACHIKEADRLYLEEVIIKSGNARAAYLYIKESRHEVDIGKFKHIFFKSKKPRYLYTLALKTIDPDELAMVEEILLKGKSDMYVRLYAANVPGANMKNCEDRILASGSKEELKKFVESTNSNRLKKLLMLF